MKTAFETLIYTVNVEITMQTHAAIQRQYEREERVK